MRLGPSKAFEILAQKCMSSCVTKQRSFDRVIFLGKQRWRVKGHHCYNYEYTIGEKLECFSEPINQHSPVDTRRRFNANKTSI